MVRNITVLFLYPLSPSAHLCLVGREGGLSGGLGGAKSAEAELSVDALDTVGGVDVLDHGDLVASGGTLTRDDGGVGKEELPDLKET